jgi:hypothetical protein
MAAKAKQQTETTIKAIKGFDADWKCRGYQYEIGKTFETNGSIVCCESGFHACDGSPFDVWAYYGPVGEDGRLTRFADVTMGGKISREDGGNDSKLASAKITIDAEITLPAFIKRAVAWVIDATKGKGDNPSGDYAQIGSSGHSAQIGSSGHYARIGSSGLRTLRTDRLQRRLRTDRLQRSLRTDRLQRRLRTDRLQRPLRTDRLQRPLRTDRL